MYTDQFLNAGTDDTLTTNTTVVVSSNSVDLIQNRDIGEGKTLYAVANITDTPVVIGFNLANTGDLITKTAHGLANGSIIRFVSFSASCGLLTTTTYYVVNRNADDFQVSLTAGGSAEPITADATATLIAYPGSMYVQAIIGTGVDGNGKINAGERVIGQSDTIIGSACADATGQKQGQTFAIKLNPLVSGKTEATASQGDLGQRYLGMRYVAASGAFTGHKVTGIFVTEIQDGRKAYTSGFTVV